MKFLEKCLSVRLSVCPTFRSPTITQKRFDRLLSNLTTETPWSLELKRFWCQSDHGGWKRVGVGRKNYKGIWKFDFTVGKGVGMCFYVGNDVYHLRIFPIWRTYEVIYVLIDRRR
jgi:hypothetical protein